MIALHWPILQVIIPLFSALLTSLVTSVGYARLIALASACMSLAVSAYGLINMDSIKRYYLGSWKAPIGIEYKLDYLNQPIMVYISCVLVFTLLCCRRIIIVQLENYITPSRRHILYTMILLVHFGLSGMIATGDLFNLYVFLEISSLASYALISQGGNKDSAVGALDYLILGTIGASFILIGIGMLFSATGTLNIDDIHFKLNGLYHSRMVILGLGFFITGCLLKIALFPLHFWMLRAYKVAAPAILVYIAGLSSIIGFYVLVRFIYFVVDYKILYELYNFRIIVRSLGLLAIIINSYLAWKAKGARELILYSMAAQIGYICLILISPKPAMLAVLASCLISDSLVKIGLFSLIGEVELKNLNTQNENPNKFLFLFLLIFTLLSNAGMPLTVGFVNKINIFSLLFNSQEYLTLTIVIAASILALEYNYKLFKIIYSSKTSVSLRSTIPIAICSLVSLILLVMNSQFTNYISQFFARVMNV